MLTHAICYWLSSHQICRLTYADPRVPDVFEGFLVVKRFAQFTVSAHRVVQTVIAHASADVARGQIHRHVKMADW